MHACLLACMYAYKDICLYSGSHSGISDHDYAQDQLLQDREGFSRGGTPSTWEREALREQQEMMAREAQWLNGQRRSGADIAQRNAHGDQARVPPSKIHDQYTWEQDDREREQHARQSQQYDREREQDRIHMGNIAVIEQARLHSSGGEADAIQQVAPVHTCARRANADAQIFPLIRVLLDLMSACGHRQSGSKRTERTRLIVVVGWASRLRSRAMTIIVVILIHTYIYSEPHTYMHTYIQT